MLQSFKESQVSISGFVQQNEISPSNSSSQSKKKNSNSNQVFDFKDINQNTQQNIDDNSQIMKRSIPKINVFQLQESEQDQQTEMKKSQNKSRVDLDQSNVSKIKKEVSKINPRHSNQEINLPKNLQHEASKLSGYNFEQYNLRNFTEEEIKEAFNFIDKSKDGTITPEDLQSYLESIGEKVTQEEIECMIKMCDYDGSNEVKFDEFYKMTKKWRLMPFNSLSPEPNEKFQIGSLNKQENFISPFQNENIKVANEEQTQKMQNFQQILNPNDNQQLKRQNFLQGRPSMKTLTPDLSFYTSQKSIKAQKSFDEKQ